jgi:hypothetical protein
VCRSCLSTGENAEIGVANRRWAARAKPARRGRFGPRNPFEKDQIIAGKVTIPAIFIAPDLCGSDGDFACR